MRLIKAIVEGTAIAGAGPKLLTSSLWLCLHTGVFWSVCLRLSSVIAGNSTIYYVQAGIETGMELKSISGNQNRRFKSVNMGLISHIGDQSMTVTVSSQDDIGFGAAIDVGYFPDWSFNPETESANDNAYFLRPYSPENPDSTSSWLTMALCLFWLG